MQRFLNQHIYDLEIYDCQQEGIETVDVNYADNHLVIETFLNVSALPSVITEPIGSRCSETLRYISHTRRREPISSGHRSKPSHETPSRPRRAIQ